MKWDLYEKRPVNETFERAYAYMEKDDRKVTCKRDIRKEIYAYEKRRIHMKWDQYEKRRY